MIQSINFSPSFKSIYYTPKKSVLNPKQMVIAEQIEEQFDKIDFSNQKGYSYLEFYERAGYDFEIEPNDRYLDIDAMFLYAKRRRKKGLFGKIVSEPQSRTFIGTYDSEKKFDVKDVEKSLYHNVSSGFDKLSSFVLFAIIGAISILGLKSDKNCGQIKEYAKSFKTDSINIIKKDAAVLK